MSAANVLGGTVRTDEDVNISYTRGHDRNVKATLVRIGKHRETAEYFQNGVMKLALLVTFLNSTSEPSHCLLWNEEQCCERDLWFQMRRIFPIKSFFYREKFKITEFDNGKYWMRESPNGGYVGIVHDEVTYVAQHRLPAQFVRNLTGVSIRAIAVTDERDRLVPRCAIMQ